MSEVNKDFTRDDFGKWIEVEPGTTHININLFRPGKGKNPSVYSMKQRFQSKETKKSLHERETIAAEKTADYTKMIADMLNAFSCEAVLTSKVKDGKNVYEVRDKQ